MIERTIGLQELPPKIDHRRLRIGRRWLARFGCYAALVPVLSALGCDALTVRSFGGTIMQFTATVNNPTAPGQHLELWGRNQYNDVLRINGNVAVFDRVTHQSRTYQPFGMRVVPAITLDEPCMIDDAGNLLTSPDAYPTSTMVEGVTQTPEQQAAQARNRIKQVTATQIGGDQTSTLLAVIAYDPTETPVPSVPADATPQERLESCKAYWNAHPLTYTPTPAQLTAPLHGGLYGFVAYTSLVPPSSYDAFRIDSPIDLKGLQELFFTVESSDVDPIKRGPIFLDSQPTPGGQSVQHFVLSGPSAAGEVSLYVSLDDPPYEF